MNDPIIPNVAHSSHAVLQPLSSLHTFGLMANCFQYQTIDTIDSLVMLLPKLQFKPFILLGDGSNTVFTQDYEGLVLKNQLHGIHVSQDEDNYHLNVASGENWHDLVCYCMAQKIYGFENLALIPGTVGACPIQNIGAYGVEIERFIHSVEFLDINTGLMGHFTNRECAFAYRDSRFKRDTDNPKVITSVNFVLPKQHQLVTSYGPLAELVDPSPENIFDKVVEIRTSKLPDPAIIGNAGSFFKNPTVAREQFVQLQKAYPNIPHFSAPEGKVKIPAAWMIDQLGYKGKSIGGIGCHEHQALVLVNHGNGTGEELLALAREIRDNVQSTYGIELENEVRVMGRKSAVIL
jgi:UDP-N-acetylmuramate dehydrogenase